MRIREGKKKKTSKKKGSKALSLAYHLIQVYAVVPAGFGPVSVFHCFWKEINQDREKEENDIFPFCVSRLEKK